MLKLKDFYHLPQLDVYVGQLVASGSGLVVVAGLDPRPQANVPKEDILLPSGRSAIFGILMQEMLAVNSNRGAVIVARDKRVVRIPRGFSRRVRSLLVEPPHSYTDRIREVLQRPPGLLVIDQLDAETAPLALEAAGKGLRVLVQFDTVLRGAQVVRQILDLGVSPDRLDGLAWVVSVSRQATLCPRCKYPAQPTPAQLEGLTARYPFLTGLVVSLLGENGGRFYRAEGCDHCGRLGRSGDIAVFDVFRAEGGFTDIPEQSSLLPLEEYLLRLIAAGRLPLDDLLGLEANQLRRTQNLLTASERALTEANVTLRRRLAELEAAYRLLERRTSVLFSLQDIGQALITSTELEDLARKVCQRAGELCGGERVILYYRHAVEGEEDSVKVLAVSGWDPALIGIKVPIPQVFEPRADPEPVPFRGPPPGVSKPSSQMVGEGQSLKAGLYAPLIAQAGQVGAMIVHSVEKTNFTPGEVALLQTFANQAALAIQRTGLIEALRTKIAQLEAAQAELVKKERLERELELARQVQQSMLPRTFPQVPGYLFAAGNQPARQVGGDFYDVIALDGDRFGILIGDVADKGMPAALYMALTRSLLLAEARRERSPCAVLDNVNRLLHELGEASIFVSVFYGVVDIATRRMTYARAGHNYPLLLRSGAVRPLGGMGAVLGVLDTDGLQLSEEQIELIPGDRLVLYTDGLTDALNPAGQFFDPARLGSLLCSHANLPSGELCSATFAELRAFQGEAEQFDDMTMLVLEVCE